jgi:hypothetical protein
MLGMARVVIPGCPYHLTQRGNCREDVSFAAAEPVRYLKLLGEYAQKHGLAGHTSLPVWRPLLPVCCGPGKSPAREGTSPPTPRQRHKTDKD